MIIKSNFFKDTHSFFKQVSKKFILPNIGNLNKSDVFDKPDFSKVTKFDLLVENELVEDEIVEDEIVKSELVDTIQMCEFSLD